tara:strand:- start:165 stop:467 length:303 start_codon:yes stop_codon:yes gene_type:complete
MKGTHLMIDDVKTYDGMDIIARNYDSGMAILYYIEITHLYLDYDLGEEGGEGEKILNKMFDTIQAPKHIQLITFNPVGRTRMENILKDNGYYFEKGWWLK